MMRFFLLRWFYQLIQELARNSESEEPFSERREYIEREMKAFDRVRRVSYRRTVSSSSLVTPSTILAEQSDAPSMHTSLNNLKW